MTMLSLPPLNRPVSCSDTGKVRDQFLANVHAASRQIEAHYAEAVDPSREATAPSPMSSVSRLLAQLAEQHGDAHEYFVLCHGR